MADDKEIHEWAIKQAAEMAGRMKDAGLLGNSLYVQEGTKRNSADQAPASGGDYFQGYLTNALVKLAKQDPCFECGVGLSKEQMGVALGTAVYKANEQDNMLEAKWAKSTKNSDRDNAPLDLNQNDIKLDAVQKVADPSADIATNVR